jgi:hypothetical protein
LDFDPFYLARRIDRNSLFQRKSDTSATLGQCPLRRGMHGDAVDGDRTSSDPGNHQSD